MANHTERRGHRRPKWAMVALRKLQEEKVEEAERAFAMLAELSQMERLPKDWAARRELCNDVMNRVWGLPKSKQEISGESELTVKVEYVKRANGATHRNAPGTTGDS